MTAPASKTPTTTYQYGMNTAQPRQGDFGGWLTGPSRPAFPQGENTYKQTNPAGGNYGEWLTGPTPTAAGGKPMDMSMYNPGSAQQTPAAAPNRAPAPANPTQMQFANPGQHLSYRAPDISAYSPGRAQPTQTQSQGSPYQTAPQSSGPWISPGVRMATPEQAAASREYAAWRQSGYAGYTPAQPPLSMDELSRLSPEQRGRLADTERSGMDQAFNQWRQGNAGSLNRNDQYAPPRREPAILIDGRSQRGPAPDQQQNPFAGMQPGVYSPTGQFYDGNLAQGLSQAQRQRDAFVMQMNQATLPYQMANVFGADLGAPSYDFQGMLGRANKMVEDGFYNPFTQYYNQDLADQMSRYAPPSMYQTDRGPRGGIYT